jgi:integrase/recombinase XerD
MAARLSPRTVEFYEETAGSFVKWLIGSGAEDFSAMHVRAYLSKLAERNLSDATLHKFARGIKAFARFCHREGYIQKAVSFDMPRVSEKALTVLSSEELKLAIAASLTRRDKAILLLLADTGIRASEALALDWCDVDIASGLVQIRKGKGGKRRSVVVGVKTRRALLAYRRTVVHEPRDPVIQTYQGTRLKHSGLRMALNRIGERAGVKLNPHMLRRTFATLSLRAGINPLHLQALMGHSSLEMTRKYIKMVDEDLLLAHKEHGPVDRWLGNR